MKTLIALLIFSVSSFAQAVTITLKVLTSDGSTGYIPVWK
jgi:hypothetical protein